MTPSRPTAPRGSKRARRQDPPAEPQEPPKNETRSWLAEPAEPPPVVPFTLPEPRPATRFGAVIASAAVVLTVIALVVVMASSASMLGRTGTPRQPDADQGTPAVPSESTTTVPDLGELATELRPVAESVGPVLGHGWVSLDAAEFEPDAAPPPGAGCAAGVGANATPIAVFGRTWSLPVAGSATPGQAIVRVASFVRADDVSIDLAAEGDLGSAACSRASLNAFRPGTDVSTAERRPPGLGTGSAGYRMVSVDGAGVVQAVTDTFVVGLGNLQATLTLSRCCTGWELANERTVVATLLDRLAVAQGLAPGDDVVAAARSSYLDEGVDPCTLLLPADLVQVGLTTPGPPSDIAHGDEGQGTCVLTAGLTTVTVTTARAGYEPRPATGAVPVTGLGDRAEWIRTPEGGTVNVWRPTSFLAITVSAAASDEASTRQVAVDLATIAGPRT